MNGNRNTVKMNTTVVLLIAAAIGVILNCVLFGSLILRQESIVDNLPQPTVVPTKEEKKAKLDENYEFINASRSDIHAGDLILVNSENPYIFDNVPYLIRSENIVSVYGKKTENYNVADMSIKLSERIIEKLNLFFEDYVSQHKDPDLLINSAYRTYDEQEKMLRDKQNELGKEQGALTAAVAGESEHHTGLAFDISVFSGGKYSAFDGKGEYALVARLFPKYGFILRYPDGKTDITGITGEPWHFRYVGVPHAKYIGENSLTLEEYTKALKRYTYDGRHLEMTDDEGNGYEVYFVPASGSETTKIPVMRGCEYSVSGNNCDGYIVTNKSAR